MSNKQEGWDDDGCSRSAQNQKPVSKAQKLADELEEVLDDWICANEAAQELRRLEAALKKANSNHEEFERRYYLEQQAKEDLLEVLKQIKALDYTRAATNLCSWTANEIAAAAIQKHGGEAT